jgi:hypothetical protein
MSLTHSAPSPESPQVTLVLPTTHPAVTKLEHAFDGLFGHFFDYDCLPASPDGSTTDRMKLLRLLDTSATSALGNAEQRLAEFDVYQREQDGNRAHIVSRLGAFSHYSINKDGLRLFVFGQQPSIYQALDPQQALIQDILVPEQLVHFADQMSDLGNLTLRQANA